MEILSLIPASRRTDAVFRLTEEQAVEYKGEASHIRVQVISWALVADEDDDGVIHKHNGLVSKNVVPLCVLDGEVVVATPGHPRFVRLDGGEPDVF